MYLFLKYRNCYSGLRRSVPRRRRRGELGRVVGGRLRRRHEAETKNVIGYELSDAFHIFLNHLKRLSSIENYMFSMPNEMTHSIKY